MVVFRLLNISLDTLHPRCVRPSCVVRIFDLVTQEIDTIRFIILLGYCKKKSLETGTLAQSQNGLP